MFNLRLHLARALKPAFPIFLQRPEDHLIDRGIDGGPGGGRRESSNGSSPVSIS